jgi:hypothetical protein
MFQPINHRKTDWVTPAGFLGRGEQPQLEQQQAFSLATACGNAPTQKKKLKSSEIRF